MKKLSALVLLVCFVLGTGLHASPPAGYVLVWSDEFDGAVLDTTAWNFIEGANQPNQEQEFYTRSCLTVENGNLVVWSKFNPTGQIWNAPSAANAMYTSGRIESQYKKEFRYGYFETRLTTPVGAVPGQGLWSAVWLLGSGFSNPAVGWPACGQMELYDQRCGNIIFTPNSPQIAAATYGDNEFIGTCDFKAVDGSVSLHSQMVTSPTPYYNKFHTFGILWDSSHVEYHVDDSLYWGPNFPTKAYTVPNINQASNRAAFHGPFFWIINVAIGGAYQGQNVKNAIFPTKMLVDYVRVYQPVVRLLSPSDGATNQPLNVLLKWAPYYGIASHFRMHVSTDSGFASIVFDDSTLTYNDTVKAIGQLLPNTTYYWRMNGPIYNGIKPWTQAWSFTTVPPPPPSPTLTSPANAAADQSPSLSLTWTAASGASTYHVQVSTIPSFTDTIVDDSTLTSTSKSVGPLSNGKTYYWRVDAKNPGGTSAWSSVWSFTTIVAIPGVPICLYPAAGATNVSVNTPLIWSKVTGATSYAAKIATDTGFSSIVKDSAGVSDTSFAWAGFTNNTHYYWRVNSTNAGGASQWSAPSDFTTIISLPSAVALLSPVNGDTVRIDSVYLLWAAGTPQVDRYEAEYASDSSFTAPIIDSAVTGNVKLLSNLKDNSTVWWHVKAHNAAGWGDWSTKRAFVVKLISTHVRVAAIPKTFSFNISGLAGSIRYALPKVEHVCLRVYSMKGQLQSEPVNMQQGAGYYTVNMQRGVSATGPYLVVFKAGE
jgi:beta-glucanase (GH16 family)